MLGNCIHFSLFCVFVTELTLFLRSIRIAMEVCQHNIAWSPCTAIWKYALVDVPRPYYAMMDHQPPLSVRERSPVSSYRYVRYDISLITHSVRRRDPTPPTHTSLVGRGTLWLAGSSLSQTLRSPMAWAQRGSCKKWGMF